MEIPWLGLVQNPCHVPAWTTNNDWINDTESSWNLVWIWTLDQTYSVDLWQCEMTRNFHENRRHIFYRDTQTHWYFIFSSHYVERKYPNLRVNKMYLFSILTRLTSHKNIVVFLHDIPIFFPNSFILYFIFMEMGEMRWARTCFSFIFFWFSRLFWLLIHFLLYGECVWLYEFLRELK